MKSPVLFLIFNRPDTTSRVFEAIRDARPPRLYVSADGPRSSRPADSKLCEEARRIATAVDWPCEVHTLFRVHNLGCKMGVSGGISWFFEKEDEGVILEDDVLPLPSFFGYCDELLERYRHNERVAMVSGCNLIARHFTPKDSYFFSRYSHIWGWASWRRAWQHYDADMKEWPTWRGQGALSSLSDGNKLFEAYWRDVFNAVYRGGIDTWDYQWTFACWRLNALSILPAYNQTHNLGFGLNATHTHGDTPRHVTSSIPQALRFPLVHPTEVKREDGADRLIDECVFGINYLTSIRRKIRSVPLLGKFLGKVKTSLRNVLR